MDATAEKSAKYTPFRLIRAVTALTCHAPTNCNAAYCHSRAGPALIIRRETYLQPVSPRLQPLVDNLRNLLIIRSIALLGQTAVLAYVLLASRTTASLVGVTDQPGLLALLTMASLWRTTRPWPVADNEFLAQLLVDVLGWTA